MRPLANRVSPVELPSDNYFANVASLFEKLEGIDVLLSDPQTTSVRLITNPEKMVLRETQRAFVYFSLYGLVVDAIMVNRVLPETVSDVFFSEWRAAQRAALEETERYFAPVPVRRVPLFTHEVLGRERLEEVARRLYAEDEDPADGDADRAAVHVREAGRALRSAARTCRSRRRARSGCSRRATNWWSRSARCGGTSGCRRRCRRWCRRGRASRIARLVVEMKER